MWVPSTTSLASFKHIKAGLIGVLGDDVAHCGYLSLYVSFFMCFLSKVCPHILGGSMDGWVSIIFDRIK